MKYLKLHNEYTNSVLLIEINNTGEGQPLYGLYFDWNKSPQFNTKQYLTKIGWTVKTITKQEVDQILIGLI
jgi:hypothetical protein